MVRAKRLGSHTSRELKGFLLLEGMTLGCAGNYSQLLRTTISWRRARGWLRRDVANAVVAHNTHSAYYLGNKFRRPERLTSTKVIPALGFITPLISTVLTAAAVTAHHIERLG